MSGLKYINEFLRLRCSTDIIELLDHKVDCKEITEAMSIRNRILPIVLKERDKYTIVDCCCGNKALFSLLAAFTLPVKKVIGIDKVKLIFDKNKVRKFEFLEKNLFDKDLEEKLKNEGNLIIVGIHCCKRLSIRVIELFNNLENARYLFLMPCCIEYKLIQRDPKKEDYEVWCEYLASLVRGKIKMERDKHVLSPRNMIIEGVKN